MTGRLKELIKEQEFLEALEEKLGKSRARKLIMKYHLAVKKGYMENDVEQSFFIELEKYKKEVEK